MKKGYSKQRKFGRLRGQLLESRGMLAGDVSVAYVGSTTLNIIGDTVDNDVTLSLVAGDLHVVNSGGTISGIISDVDLTGITKINILLGQGDDSLTFDPFGFSVPGVDLLVNLGMSPNGDTFDATDLVARDLSITSGAGADDVTIAGFTGRNVNINVDGSSAAGQNVDLSELALTGTLRVVAGSAGDANGSALIVDDATATTATFTVAAGDSDVTIDDVSTTKFTLNTGGMATIDLGMNTANAITGSFAVTTGAGADVGIGDNGKANTIGGQTTILLGGNSALMVTDVEFNNGVIVKLGNGATNSVDFDGLDINGRLSIQLGNAATNTVTLADTDAFTDVAGTVTIQVGTASVKNDVSLTGSAANSLAITGLVTISSNDGDADIAATDVLVSNGGGSGAPGVTISAKAGLIDIDLAGLDAEGVVSLRSGNTGDSTSVTVTDGSSGSLSVVLGTAVGSNTVTVDGTTVAGNLTVTSGNAAGNTIDIDASIGRNLAITTKNGDDAITVVGSVGATTTISTGNDEDTVTLGQAAVATFTKAVSINLGANDDILTVGLLVNDAAGAFVPGAYLVSLDGGVANTDTINTNLASFDPVLDLQLKPKVKNFETIL